MSDGTFQVIMWAHSFLSGSLISPSLLGLSRESWHPRLNPLVPFTTGLILYLQKFWIRNCSLTNGELAAVLDMYATHLFPSNWSKSSLFVFSFMFNPLHASHNVFFCLFCERCVCLVCPSPETMLNFRFTFIKSTHFWCSSLLALYT